MNTSGEAVDQVVRMSLNGVEVAARITGAAAKELAVLLYAILRDQKKTKGKTRLANMLRSGKELKVFAVKDQDLKLFCQEAKAYGALYCVLKNKHAKDGVTDVMVRAEDASKINRIYERFHLATVDMGTIKSEIERAVERPTAERSEDERAGGAASQKEKSDHRKEEQRGNPTEGRTGQSRPSEPTSKPRESTAGGISDVERSPRPSVRQDLRNIRAEQAKAAAAKSRDQSRRQYAGHNAPAKKPKVLKGRGR